MSDEAIARVQSTLDHAKRLLAKRDDLHAALEETFEALIVQLGRVEWEPAEMVAIWEFARSAKITHLARRIAESMGTSTGVLVNWRNTLDAVKAGGGRFPLGYQPVPGRGVPCVYVLMDDDRRVLYVGYSVNVKNRLKTHWRGGRIPTTQYEVFVRATPAEAWQLEGDLIFQHRPPYNVAGTSTRRYA